MLLSGSEIIIECLKEQGVDTVFGYPGESKVTSGYLRRYAAQVTSGNRGAILRTPEL